MSYLLLLLVVVVFIYLFYFILIYLFLLLVSLCTCRWLLGMQYFSKANMINMRSSDTFPQDASLPSKMLITALQI